MNASGRLLRANLNILKMTMEEKERSKSERDLILLNTNPAEPLLTSVEENLGG